jgi:hypothetical protein
MDGPGQANSPAGGSNSPANQAPNQPAGKKGYGKRPLWQWIVLYVVIGAVVYFLIYLIFFTGGSDNGGSLY